MTSCERCGGRELIQLDQFHATDCLCTYAEAKRQFLGDELFEADKLRESPLVGVTIKHAFITGNTAPHVRLALGRRWHAERDFTFKVVTDEAIRLAYFNDAGASMMEGAPLVIVRLGYRAMKNDAFPGIMHAAIRHRVNILKQPLWLIEDPGAPFRFKNENWSETDTAIARFKRYEL